MCGHDGETKFKQPSDWKGGGVAIDIWETSIKNLRSMKSTPWTVELMDSGWMDTQKDGIIDGGWMD